MYYPKTCRCGLPTILKTSWKPRNPGRRFHCCPKPEPNCGIVDWYDPPMCERSVAIIPGLLNNMNRLQDSSRENLLKARRLKWITDADDDYVN
ncbi:zinc finger, GRF-type [Artemisia annua]|uniref:Zinc finger, GRF-type n=1 Tax=Artemisia annua TaxID=35608 RepID=A0A2U1KMX2_ARTAN|nr:zinc finger, GRF-type [Artemisia annua]